MLNTRLDIFRSSWKDQFYLFYSQLYLLYNYINFQNKHSNIVMYPIFSGSLKTIILSVYNIEVFVMLFYLVLFALFIMQIEEKTFIIACCI